MGRAKLTLAIIEFLAGWLIGVIVWAISHEPISLIVGAVGTYFAISTAIIHRTENEIKNTCTTSLTGLAASTLTGNSELKTIFENGLSSVEQGMKSLNLSIKSLTNAKSIAAYEKGRCEILERDAIRLMREGAEEFKHRMIATSYYDLAAWSTENVKMGKTQDKDYFWSIYDESSRLSLEKIKERLKKGFSDDLSFVKFLKDDPIITRIFIIDDDKWTQCRTSIRRQEGTDGYKVLCALKSQVIRLGLGDETRAGRVENLHDCVMFDDSYIVEILAEHSQWPGNEINTYGIVYLPTFQNQSYWKQQFDSYFNKVKKISFSCDEADTRLIG